MWPPNIVGAYFLVACLMGIMLGMALEALIIEWRDKHK